MDRAELNKLNYRRQYVLSPNTIVCPFEHNVITVNNKFHLYVHTDLPVNQYCQNNVQLILLGDIFDYRYTRLDNAAILKNIADSDFKVVLEKLAGYAGRFVLFFVGQNSVTVVHDASATRKVFYCNHKDGYWLSSQPHLLARLAGIPVSGDASKISFYGSEAFRILNNSNIGDTTIYDAVFQLLPNHYLELGKAAPIRYWPNKKISRISANEAADKCSLMLKGYVESMANRYELMVPVTAGKDSRTILSATRSISDKVYYYINQEKNLNEHSNDIKIPKRILASLNLEFHINDIYKLPIDYDFKEIYTQDMPYPLYNFLPHVNTYYHNFNNKVNLPGLFVGAAYEMYGTYTKGITPEMLAIINNVNEFPHAREYYKRWFNGIKDICQQDNVNLFILFYWEERLANWGTQIQMFKDIAQEDFMPFNSRELIECICSVHPRYLDRSGYLLHRKIMRRLWPETLKEPFNPGFKHALFYILFYLGLLNVVRKLRFIMKYKIKKAPGYRC
jgi:hypothetical protein